MDAGMDGLDALMAELAAGYAPRSAYTCLPFRGGPGLGRDGALPTARSRLPACLTREQRPSPQARPQKSASACPECNVTARTVLAFIQHERDGRRG